MAIFTFSTKDKHKPTDKEDVRRIKDYCKDRGINFSALVIRLLREWESENVGRD
jgi:hypothetical protein